MTEGVTKAPNSISQRSVDLCWICQVQWSLPTAEAVSLHMLGVLCLQNKKAARIGKTSYMASSNPRPPSCCFTIQLCENWARQIEDPVCVCVCVCVRAVSRSIVSTSLQPHVTVRRALLSLRFSRQEYWNGLPFSQTRDRSHISCVSCTAGGFFTTELSGKPEPCNYLSMCL